MADLIIKITSSGEDDFKKRKWEIEFNGDGWIKPEVIKGGFDADYNTVIDTPLGGSGKEDMIYALIRYAEGDM